MSDSGAVLLLDANGVEVFVQNGVAVPAGTKRLLVAGTDAAGNVQTPGVLATAPAGTEYGLLVRHAGAIAVSNLPATQPVSGTVAIGNLPATQPVSGTVALASGTAVAVSNLPATQAVSGTVAIGNLPATQPISGTVGLAAGSQVAVSNLPATQPVSGTVSVGNLPATQAVAGTVAVSNLPSTQVVSGAVSVSNLPATQAVSGAISVTNLPATQPVSGTVAVSNFPPSLTLQQRPTYFVAVTTPIAFQTQGGAVTEVLTLFHPASSPKRIEIRSITLAATNGNNGQFSLRLSRMTAEAPSAGGTLAAPTPLDLDDPPSALVARVLPAAAPTRTVDLLAASLAAVSNSTTLITIFEADDASKPIVLRAGIGEGLELRAIAGANNVSTSPSVTLLVQYTES